MRRRVDPILPLHLPHHQQCPQLPRPTCWLWLSHLHNSDTFGSGIQCTFMVLICKFLDQTDPYRNLKYVNGFHSPTKMCNILWQLLRDWYWVYYSTTNRNSSLVSWSPFSLTPNRWMFTYSAYPCECLYTGCGAKCFGCRMSNPKFVHPRNSHALKKDPVSFPQAHTIPQVWVGKAALFYKWEESHSAQSYFLTSKSLAKRRTHRNGRAEFLDVI